MIYMLYVAYIHVLHIHTHTQCLLHKLPQMMTSVQNLFPAESNTLTLLKLSVSELM